MFSYSILFSVEKQKKKASAWYYAAYRAGTKLSFAWIMKDLMCAIPKTPPIVQKDQLIFELFGQSLYEQGFDVKVKQLVDRYHLTNKKEKDGSEMIRLAKQFINIIELPNQSETDQESIHRFLITLHRIILDNL
jgi:hypothetical protein